MNIPRRTGFGAGSGNMADRRGTIRRPWFIRLLVCVIAVCSTFVIVPRVEGQTVPISVQSIENEILDIDRPRIAIGQNGSFAVAIEIYTQGQFEASPRWKIAVQRYSPQGTPVGPWNIFRGESCSTLDIWTNDWMEHAELAFRLDGVLVVLMQHAGRFSLGGVDDVASSEVTIGAIDPQGQIIKLSDRVDCVQHKLIFPGARRQDRPRMALAPNAQMLVISDGFFGGSNFRNVGIRALDADLSQLIEEIIPHSDPMSEQSFHVRSDVATNGSLILFVWQQCPMIDNQGNANFCNIGGQFAAPGGDGLVAVGGGNFQVNTGAPAGTIAIWPSAAMNAAGNSVVVWTDARTGPQGDIFGQRFNASGQPLGGNLQISTTQGMIFGRAEVAMKNDGGFMVVWTDSSTVGYRARGREYDGAGNPLSAPFILPGDNTIHSGLTAVDSDGSRFVYSYAALRPGEPIRVYASNLSFPVAAEPELPFSADFRLTNYPNPFENSTTISFHLERPASVELKVIDLLGRTVAVLAQGPHVAGNTEVTFEAGSLPGGVYFYRLETETSTSTGRLVLQR